MDKAQKLDSPNKRAGDVWHQAVAYRRPLPVPTEDNTKSGHTTIADRDSNLQPQRLSQMNSVHILTTFL
jgi:hypothetical protein